MSYKIKVNCIYLCTVHLFSCVIVFLSVIMTFCGVFPHFSHFSQWTCALIDNSSHHKLIELHVIVVASCDKVLYQSSVLLCLSVKTARFSLNNSSYTYFVIFNILTFSLDILGSSPTYVRCLTPLMRWWVTSVSSTRCTMFLWATIKQKPWLERYVLLTLFQTWRNAKKNSNSTSLVNQVGYQEKLSKFGYISEAM